MADPTVLPHEVLLRIESVGVCGTDFHIYDGSANYNVDGRGRPIPLQVQPQILGHEFSGRIEDMGAGVTGLGIGQQVVVDQVRTCVSERRAELCEFCVSGDSHQCECGLEAGITGVPGAFADLLAVPAANVIPIPEATSPLTAALVEPTGCVFHAMDRLEHSALRYCFGGPYRIRSVVIIGGGPAGLLFLQYIRNVLAFDGNVVLADRRHRSLELASRFGAKAVDVSAGDPADLATRKNGGARFELLIEASGNGRVFEWLPLLAKRQANLLLYGAGHGDLTAGCLTPWQAMEFNVVTSAGASGRIGPDGVPVTYGNALQALVRGQFDVDAIVTHRYPGLTSLAGAFENDHTSSDYVKGVMVQGAAN
ncbi:MAG: alcohol dehydrogenase catalytic domain-containing protein [Acidobacteriaceae bacterium]|nr:alcohol dehydrogenase catalytic domain-containing protein [Acidobacteriaceae bacterium]